MPRRGIVLNSPGLRRRRYPGLAVHQFVTTPTGLRHPSLARVRRPWRSGGRTVGRGDFVKYFTKSSSVSLFSGEGRAARCAPTRHRVRGEAPDRMNDPKVAPRGSGPCQRPHGRARGESPGDTTKRRAFLGSPSRESGDPLWSPGCIFPACATGSASTSRASTLPRALRLAGLRASAPGVAPHLLLGRPRHPH